MSRSRSRSRNRERDRGRDRDRDRHDRDRDDRDRHRDTRRRSRSRERPRHGRSRSRSRSRDRGRSRRSPERRHDADTHTRSRHADARPDRQDHAPVPARPILGPVSDQPPPLNTVHSGKVHTIRPFGLFVAIPGYRKHVLVHHTQIHDDIQFSREDLDEDKVKGMEFFFPQGTPVKVKITEINTKEGGDLKVCGSMKVVDQESGQDLDPANLKSQGHAQHGGPLSDEPPEVGTVLRATVKRIEPYGVFVSMVGYRKYGLVHSSQVSNYLAFTREHTDEEKKAELAGVVSVGETVFVKVVEVSEDDGSGRGPKIQCSIKLVDQKTGEDLDPMGTRYRPRGEQGGHGGRGQGPLGADAGEIVGGKINWGHLAGDAKLHAGDHTGAYKMLEASKEEAAPPKPTSLYELVDRSHPSGHALLLPDALPPPPPPPKTITTIEEALAIMEQAAKEKKGKGTKRKKHKDKDKKKKKKSKGKDKEKSKKHKARKGGRESSGGSSSDSSDTSSSG